MSIVLALFGMLSALGARHGFAQTGNGLHLTNNLSGLPERSDITVQPLARSVKTVDAATAVAAAEREWGFTNAELDSRVHGVIRARVSVAGNPRIQGIPGLLVVADIRTPIAGPVHGFYNKMVVVINAVTGKPVISYPFDTRAPV